METKRHTLSAVHGTKVEAFLESLGVLSAFNAGECKCKFCKEPVTPSTLYAVFPDGGHIKFVCITPACIAQLVEHRSELRGKDIAEE